MTRSLLVTIALLIGIIAMTPESSAADNPAATPTKRNDWSTPVSALWMQKAKKQKEAEGAIDVLFVGDSITHLWMNDPRWPNGQKIWDKNYKLLKAVNFGVAGDRTDHLLWRIDNDKMIDGLTPKVTILLIGVNNLTGWTGRKDRPEQVAAAITMIVDRLKQKMPMTKILVLGVFPCMADATNPIREQIRRVNEITAKLHDGKTVWFLDFGDKLLRPDKAADKSILRDELHLSEKGYEVWAKNMNPYLLDLLNNNGNGNMWQKKR